MAQIGTYINNVISNIEGSYNPEVEIKRFTDPEIKREWSSLQQRRNIEWEQIKNIDDVYRLIDVFKNTVESINQIPFGNLHVQDKYEMDVALYRVLQGLRKIAKLKGTITLFQPEWVRSISESEIDNMAETIITTINKMKSISVRKAMQD